MKNIELYDSLKNLYEILRDEGFSKELDSLNKLMYSLEINDLINFRKYFKSKDIWGGAGSIRDISIRDIDKQNKIDTYLKVIKNLGKKI